MNPQQRFPWDLWSGQFAVVRVFRRGDEEKPSCNLFLSEETKEQPAKTHRSFDYGSNIQLKAIPKLVAKCFNITKKGDKAPSKMSQLTFYEPL